MTSRPDYAFTVSPEERGRRLDVVLAARLSPLSRARAAHLIRTGSVTVNDLCQIKAAYAVQPRDRIGGRLPDVVPPDLVPEELPLEVLFQDRHLAVINKPPGLVVHPAAGHFRGTLANALLHHFPALGGWDTGQRPGIVHRLDKDTSGLLLVALTPQAQVHLAAQFKARSVTKTYRALVWGRMPAGQGRITAPIGRHPSHRKRMAVWAPHGREADTRWRRVADYERASALEVDLKTGRTHQIRVHLAAEGHPLVGDTLYGGGLPHRLPAGWRTAIQPPPARQMLHAWRLSIDHPANGRRLAFEAPLPADLAALERRLAALAGASPAAASGPSQAAATSSSSRELSDRSGS